jgi:hypothetical protein
MFSADAALSAHNVDFPAPLEPTMAMRESSPTSKLTLLMMIFSLV